ncbi:MAG TPA: tRNA (cytidine(34)-2'-O)-methyltransferase [Rhodospirillaceae bacterium]|nr:tRNA (cytidine(34)-2'-O)-methyltransferase [Rhodospirillaceae bacterium]
MRLALYQPDIPQNVGAIIRLAACFGIPLEVIGPCGFLWDDRRLKRAGMDYLGLAEIRQNASWADFLARREPGRLILLTTAGDGRHVDFAFRPDDVLLFGRESAGVPAEVHDLADARLRIPLRPGARSLNLSISAAMALAEALRQTGGWPEPAVA